MKLFLAMLLMFSGYAFAGCNSINDLDQRAYCSANTTTLRQQLLFSAIDLG